MPANKKNNYWSSFEEMAKTIPYQLYITQNKSLFQKMTLSELSLRVMHITSMSQTIISSTPLQESEW